MGEIPVGRTVSTHFTSDGVRLLRFTPNNAGFLPFTLDDVVGTDLAHFTSDGVGLLRFASDDAGHLPFSPGDGN